MGTSLILFYVFAGLAVAGALNLVLQRHPVHSALSLILVMVALAVLYLLIGAEFIAAIQIIVYAGAIMVLFLFVIMVLNAAEEETSSRSRLVKVLGLPLSVVFIAEASLLVWRSWPNPSQVIVPARFIGSAHKLGEVLFEKYLLPFEVTGVLILVALLGAVVIARQED